MTQEESDFKSEFRRKFLETLERQTYLYENDIITMGDYAESVRLLWGIGSGLLAELTDLMNDILFEVGNASKVLDFVVLDQGIVARIARYIILVRYSNGIIKTFSTGAGEGKEFVFDNQLDCARKMKNFIEEWQKQGWTRVL